MYSSLFEVSQWCKAVDLLGKRRKITLISCFGEISGSRGHGMSHFLVKISAIFLLIALVSYTGSESYVFMDELAEAVSQFLPVPGEGLLGHPGSPTPPPGNSGVEFLPGSLPQNVETGHQERRSLLTLLKKHLQRYCADQKVAQKFPDLQFQEIDIFAERLAIEELEINGKPVVEVAELTRYLKPFQRSKSFFNSFFNRFFDQS
nr:hypothetical protein P8546_mgp24 [Helianthus argophyllus]WEL36303.1 hypothetical protein [Helianthus argophyllus]